MEGSNDGSKIHTCQIPKEKERRWFGEGSNYISCNFCGLFSSHEPELYPNLSLLCGSLLYVEGTKGFICHNYLLKGEIHSYLSLWRVRNTKEIHLQGRGKG